MVTALVTMMVGVVVSLPPATAAVTSAGMAPSEVLQNEGAFTTKVNIAVPSFHGVEPSLALTYNSGCGDGPLGVGWDLSGANSIIERASSGWGAPTYGSSDIFLLDGEELVPSTALGGTHVTKRQTYLKISYDSSENTWTVWGRNGVKSVYTPGHVVSSNVFRWFRTQTVDLHGNRVNYSYWCDPGNYCYLNTIKYGTTVITLYRESRTNATSSAVGGALATINYRIATIDVTVNDTRSRAYKLTYSDSTTTGRSLLTTVQQFGTDAKLDSSGKVAKGTSLPAVTLGYSTNRSPYDFLEAEAKVISGESSVTEWCVEPAYFALADLNQDDKDDLLCHDFSAGTTKVAFSKVTVTSSWSQNVLNFAAGTPVTNWCRKGNTTPEIGTADINADGHLDIWCRDTSSGIWVALANSSGGFTKVTSPLTGWCVGTKQQFETGDFNGDGKADLWCHDMSSGNSWLAISAGSGEFSTASAALTNWCVDGSGWCFDVADFNGDGKMDLWCHDASTGNTWWPSPPDQAASPRSRSR